MNSGGGGGDTQSTASTSFLGVSAHPASVQALLTFLSDEYLRSFPKTVKQRVRGKEQDRPQANSFPQRTGDRGCFLGESAVESTLYVLR